MNSVKIPDLFRSLLGTLGSFGSGLWRVYSNSQDNSLIEATRSARVEPLTLISQNCSTLEYLPDINQGVLDLFIGYYLQAVALLASIEDVKVVRFLDKLNPDRDLNDVMLFESYHNKFVMAEECYQFKLPMAKTDKENKTFNATMNYAIEKSILDASFSTPEMTDEPGDVNIKGNYEADRHTSQILRETADLSSGKLINVTIRINEEAVSVPVSFRLAATLTPAKVIENICTYHKDDNTFIERYHAWRSGRISLIRDLILCQDLIDENKKMIMQDNNNIFSEIMKRVNNNKKYGLLSDNPSLATASNIFIITEDEASQIGSDLGGKFGSKVVMRKIFENSYAMIIVVIDREWQMISYYSRGISAPTTVSVKDIKKRAKKENGSDLLNILKSYNLGSAPSF